MLGFRGWGLGLGPKAPSSGALLLQGAQVAEGPSAEAQQYPEPYSIQKPNSIHKLTAGARKKGAKRPEFLVQNTAKNTIILSQETNYSADRKISIDNICIGFVDVEYNGK